MQESAHFPVYLCQFSAMKNTNNPFRSAYSKLLIAVVAWGGSFIATKIAVAQVAPVTVVWSRFALGVLLMGLAAQRRKLLAPPPVKDLLQFAWLGLLGITLHQWLQSSGLVTSQASTTAWIVATTPLFMAALGWVFLRERIGWPGVGGIALATLGVLLVVSKGEMQNILSGGFSAPGDLLILISAPNWAIYSVLSRDALKKHPALKMTFYTALFGWLLTSLQFAWGGHWTEFSQLDLQGWLSIAYLGILCTFLAYIYWYDALKVLPAAHVGAFLYIEPVVSMVMAALVLDEKIGLASVLGGCMILLGIWLVKHQPRKGN